MLRMMLLIVALGATTQPSTTTAPSEDAELARRLVGVWVSDPAEPRPLDSIVTLNADGTGTEVAYERGKPPNSGVTVTTRWSIKDRILSVRSITSSDPQRIPPGIQLMDRIISISDEKFVWEAGAGYGTAGGTRHTSLRKK